VTDLFLSYKAEDRARVAPLVQALETDGLSVWWDAHIGGGDEWRDTILRHLEAARAVIVVWSRRSIGPNGQFVRDEATRALKRGSYLPVRIDKVDPPLGFGETQALDLHGWKGDRSDPRYVALLSMLQKRLGMEVRHASERPSAAAPGVSRRTIITGAGLVIAASAAGFGALFLQKEKSGGESIAVLPFANLSGDPNQAYFSDGIAEELRSALSRIAGLKVVARTSSEAVRDVDAKTAAHKLGVSSILTGSVRRSPQMVRVSAQLIDGSEGTERWSEVYDRPVVDALQIQTDIANRVADAMSVRLGNVDRRRIQEGGTSNADAHDLLLKAKAINQADDNPDTLQRALGLVDAAIALDPKYADAFAAKAQLLTIRVGTYSKSGSEYRLGYADAERVAYHAIQLAPRSRAGYLALVDILDQQLKRRAALAQLQKLASLPGEDSSTLSLYALFLSEMGRNGEALRMADRALALDPLNAASYVTKTRVLAQARRYADAMQVNEQTSRLAPDVKAARGGHAFQQAMLGNIAQARKELEKYWGDPADAPPFFVAPLVANDHALGERLLDRLRRTAGDGAHYQFAEIYAQLGRKDAAIEALEKAWTVRDPGLTGILVDPMLDPVRSDPRFQSLVKRLDFPT
jgi:serine/threonine-protein kinase